MCYNLFMIKTFKCKETKKIFNRQFSKKLPSDIQEIVYRKLLMIDSAIDVNDLKIPPVNHLEKLTGDRKGQYSIRVNRQFRICFLFEDGFAFEVELVDYH